ncbi:MAG: N-acetylmuramoyl-L-alanine amidase, partial [Candidatus Omnitrophica bacterium]|nr:N-acetylmuramoyl-L-alanine amidase [Candidatus Omnitrophota bacterium]
HFRYFYLFSNCLMDAGIMINRKRLLIYYLILLSCMMILAGCGSSVQSTRRPQITRAEYVGIEKFCSESGLSYNYDTIDEMLHLTSQNRDIKLLINSSIGIYNGNFFDLKAKTLRIDGKLFIPKALEQLISSKKYISFKPVFSIKKIVIDPGHGGKDPGAISCRGLKEKTINLIIAKALKKKLQSQGYEVFLTRENDQFLSLRERTEFTIQKKADLFISIHANSNRSRSVKGVEIYYLTSDKLNSYKRSVKLARSMSYFTKNAHADVETILWDMVLTKNYSHSIEISNILYFTFKRLGFNIKPPRTAGFYVLKNAYVPSVLVEMGYLSNSTEEKTLRKKSYQNQIVEAISLSILSLEKRYAELARSE